jgi:hypothetical protein
MKQQLKMQIMLEKELKRCIRTILSLLGIDRYIITPHRGYYWE